MSVDPKTLLDNEFLDDAYKKQLVAAWASANEDDEELWQPYLDKYGLDDVGADFGADQYAALLAEGEDFQNARADQLHLIDSANAFNDPDDVLDRGVCGLEFFEMFLPSAQRLGYAKSDENLEEFYYRKYDRERGMNLRPLANDIDILNRSLTAGTGELEEQQRCTNLVRAGWTDDVGVAAVAASDAQNVRMEANIGRMQDLSLVLFETNLTLSKAVTLKALTVSSLYAPTVGGYTAAQIRVLADIYADGKDGDNSWAKDCMENAAQWFEPLAGDDYAHINGLAKDNLLGTWRAYDRDGVVKDAAEIAKKWLDANFKVEYERKRDEFEKACEDCTRDVEDAYRIATEAAQNVQAQGGWRPAETPVPGVGAPGPGVPNAGTPAAVPPSGPTVQNVGATPQNAPQNMPQSTGTDSAGAEGTGGGSGPASAPTNSGGGGGSGGTAATVPAGAAPMAQPGVLPGAGSAPGVGGLPGLGGILGSNGLGGLSGLGGMQGLSAIPGMGGMPGLSDLAGMGQTLSGGLGEIRNILEPLVEDAVSALISDREDPDDRDGTPSHEGEAPSEQDGKPEKSLELKLDGKSWTLALDEDGKGLHLEMSDGQGGTSRFGIEIGPNGLPQFVASGEDAAAVATETKTETEPETPAVEQQTTAEPIGTDVPPVDGDTNVGDAPPVPEPVSDETPAPPPPAAPETVPPVPEVVNAPPEEFASEEFDSGAVLAEAGPM